VFTLLLILQVSPEETLRALAEKMKGATSLRAQVVQRRKTALLEEPIVSKGVLHWRREPGRLLILISEPKETRVRIDRGAYEVYRPDEKRLERIEFAGDESAGKLLEIFDPKPAEIGKAFELRPAGEGEVLLVPKDEKVRRRVKSIGISVSAADGSLKRIRTEDADGDETVFELSGTELNPELPSGFWDPAVPEGTRVLVHRARQ
jgi:outer membrane lipoprotein-sorting protein